MEIDEVLCLVCGKEGVFQMIVQILEEKTLKCFLTASFGRGGHKWKSLEEMAENHKEITVHPTSKKHYTRNNSVKSYKKSVAENNTQITSLKIKLKN